MTKTEQRQQKLQAADASRMADRRALRQERQLFQTSNFIMVFAEMLDRLLPFGMASVLGRSILRRRIRRHSR